MTNSRQTSSEPTRDALSIFQTCDPLSQVTRGRCLPYDSACPLSFPSASSRHTQTAGQSHANARTSSTTTTVYSHTLRTTTTPHRKTSKRCTPPPPRNQPQQRPAHARPKPSTPSASATPRPQPCSPTRSCPGTRCSGTRFVLTNHLTLQTKRSHRL